MSQRLYKDINFDYLFHKLPKREMLMPKNVKRYLRYLYLVFNLLIDLLI